LHDAVRRRKSQLITLNCPDQCGERNFIRTSMFADDQVVMADDENAMQRALYEVYKNSLRKTKCWHSRGNSQLDKN
jgi:hypothetical protein